MSGLRRIGAALAAGAALTAGTAAAQDGDPPHVLLGTTQQTGYIDLGFLGPVGLTVDFHEVLDDTIKQHVGTAVVEANGAATLLRQIRWSCDRQVRTFTATATTPEGRRLDGRFEVRTPGCANRVLVAGPAHAARGRLAKVRLTDRWTLGATVDACVSGAGLHRSCRKVTLRGAAPSTIRLRPTADGQLRVAVAVEGHRVTRTVAVGRARARGQHGGPVLLATGDSMIQGIDSWLADRLGSAADVRRQFFPASGLTTPGYSTTWLQRSRQQVGELRPRVTVVAIGANDGYPIRGVECCGPAWVEAYARRERALMKSYLQAGAGRLVWLTLPVPESPGRQITTAAVNAATPRAAKGLEGVRVIDLNAIFAPDGRYHATITHEGRTVTVREPDGVHLNVAGAAIATDVVIAAIERERWLD